jgi:capsid assembly protease
MASAAYWLAASASEIVALPSAQVGSIGVFSMHEDVSKALDEKGVKVTLISAGKFKTEGNPFEPLSDDAKAAVQGTVDFYYGQFTSDVANGRGVAVDSVRAGFGEGRVVTAKDALKLGMIDRVGTLDDVVGDLLRGKAPQGQRASVLADAQAIPEPVADVQTPVGEVQTAVAALPPAADGTPEAWMADLELRKMKLRILELDE